MSTANNGIVMPLVILVVLTFISVSTSIVLYVCFTSRWYRHAKTIGFFHPYCNAGGGGERVLFCAIKYFLRANPDWSCVVYTGDLDASKEDILLRCRERFGEGSWPEPDLHPRITFVHLVSRSLVEAKSWPRLTLLGQSVGSVILGIEAICRCSCEVYLDSMGYAFTLPVARIFGGSRCGSYVHYPTVSLDMLDQVRERRPSYNNSERIAKSETVSRLKLIYYTVFAWFYGAAGGRFSSVTMVNSTWTKNHIDSIWKVSSTLTFPPCISRASLGEPIFGNNKAPSLTGGKKQKISKTTKSDLRALGGDEFQDGSQVGEVDNSFREDGLIVSVGQFRPEKDHRLQLKSLAEYQKNGRGKRKSLKLVMIGSCRDSADRSRVEELRNFATIELSLKEGVDFEFALDVPKEELDLYMERAQIGVHTMWNEHFGIGIVEMMQRGCLVVAHNSGGPRMDIVKDGDTGFLAASEEEYAAKFDLIANHLSAQARLKMQNEARRSILRFTEEEFGRSFIDCVKLLL